MFTDPVGPVEDFFYWPETVLGNFYWPGAIGSPLVSSPAQCESDLKISCSSTPQHIQSIYNTTFAIILK